MELKGYNSEDPLFQESNVKSESRVLKAKLITVDKNR
jgi:hypothetical protein